MGYCLAKKELEEMQRSNDERIHGASSHFCDYGYLSWCYKCKKYTIFPRADCWYYDYECVHCGEGDWREMIDNGCFDPVKSYAVDTTDAAEKRYFDVQNMWVDAKNKTQWKCTK